MLVGKEVADMRANQLWGEESTLCTMHSKHRQALRPLLHERLQDIKYKFKKQPREAFVPMFRRTM